jgi:hypothetical protein
MDHEIYAHYFSKLTRRPYPCRLQLAGDNNLYIAIEVYIGYFSKNDKHWNVNVRD